MSKSLRKLWLMLRESALLLMSWRWPKSHWLPRLRRSLRTELDAENTDEFLEVLLRGMSLAFRLSPSYRWGNLRGPAWGRGGIRDFRAAYSFAAEDNTQIAFSAVFGGRRMKVKEKESANPDVRVTFSNTQAWWAWLLSEDQDVLDAVLAGDVQVEGNVNYLYKFMYMFRDLRRRLRLGVR